MDVSICSVRFVLYTRTPEGRGWGQEGKGREGRIKKVEASRFRNEILLSLARVTTCQHEETTSDVVMPTKAVPSTLVQRWYSPAGAPNIWPCCRHCAT